MHMHKCTQILIHTDTHSDVHGYKYSYTQIHTGIDTHTDIFRLRFCMREENVIFAFLHLA